ncbi:MAG: hypothetical protein Q4F45_00755 [Alistipes sp.]|nr:hypothetical protein [Alistipes sp.]MDO5496387.1 hypothetical protein [Alistipes sp.]
MMSKIFKYLLVAIMAAIVALAAWAAFSTPEIDKGNLAELHLDKSSKAFPTAVNANLYLGYVLFAVAVVAALFSALWDMIKRPEGILGTVISLVIVVGVVVAAWFIASSNVATNPNFVIEDLQNHSVFGSFETTISWASIIVTGVVFAGAVLSAIYSAISDAVK